jgi:hypothetical protein
MTFEEFWPEYVRLHSHPLNRALHVVGSLGPLVFTGVAIATRNAWWLAAIPVVSYGFAWAGHFLVERNRPATFDHFWLSLAADYKMVWLTLAGRPLLPTPHDGAR